MPRAPIVSHDLAVSHDPAMSRDPVPSATPSDAAQPKGWARPSGTTGALSARMPSPCGAAARCKVGRCCRCCGLLWNPPSRGAAASFLPGSGSAAP
eukprot:CAMPEP_0181182988 /NCGR_PEP_ID=MMETSP1096-20121128/8179_1 /TAXON_ID=156174 ORGANISM="Chrysochromulina ericina, Strain CCMP281" /NCGR_SAMPLE_ID=MMETSP1096 /ASSEMBLY_ACC=CAM_ASM_000453 /LENGTH=95 /DNA_ID=CAMNT_0023271625 /DNA_START=164 /DNA_END=451 /DNA_ORIENTATION=+